MARIAKSGLEYFPLDIDFFQDIRIRKLIKRKGGKAVTVYTLLLCLIYKNGYYMQWDEELPFIGSEMSGYEEAYVAEVIDTCLSLGLFDKTLYETEQVLTSKGIQERYCNIQRLNKRMSRIDEYCLLELPKEKSTRKAKSKQGKPVKCQVTPKPPIPETPPQGAEPIQELEPAPTPQPQPVVPTPPAQGDDAEWLTEFFANNNSENLKLLCKNFGLERGDIARLRSLADEVVAEWGLSRTAHRDYSDWSRHLISCMRIKNRESQPKQKPSTGPARPPKSSDYGSGFGGKDI